MGKITTILFVLAILALVSSAAAAGVTVSVDSATAAEGKTVTLPVKVTGASNLGAMDLVLTYDSSVLKFSNAELGELSTNGLVEGNELQAGTAKISFADTKGINGDGTILKVTFTVTGKKGASTDIGASAQAYGLDLKDIPTTATGGKVTVSSPGLGLEIAVILLSVGAAVVVFRRRGE
ncbi:MAG: hypothetical protein GYA23_00170 [Methanomicrobiales archaeon]|nr:hypothetical protein [Methanomicrobiales archaeon]